MLKILFVIASFAYIIFIFIPFVARLMRNERFKKDGRKTHGTVTFTEQTGISFFGVPQMKMSLKYDIDGVSYEGFATLFTRQVLPIGSVVPIRVNPNDLIECSVISSE